MSRITPFVVAVLLVLSAGSSQASPSEKLGCDFIKMMHHTNFGSRNASAEILHSVVILYNDDAVGWIFQTQDSKMYYVDGPFGDQYANHQPAPPEVAKAVLGFLLPRYSATEIQKGAVYPIPDQFHLDKLVGLNLEVKGCY